MRAVVIAAAFVHRHAVMRRLGLAWLVLGLLPLVLPTLACEVEPSGDDEIAETSSTTAGVTTSDESESSGERGETDDCITGSLGCTCAADQTCAVGLVCVAGVCEFQGCEPGSYGCSCLPDATCSEDWMQCEAGVCEYGCSLGSAGCACSPTGCAVGLECIAGECWAQSPYPNCGWDDEHDWYACGSSVAFPWGGLACPETELVAGMPCPIDPGVYTTGCCDTNGNNWWCEGGVLAFDDCSDAP